MAGRSPSWVAAGCPRVAHNCGYWRIGKQLRRYAFKAVLLASLGKLLLGNSPTYYGFAASNRKPSTRQKPLHQVRDDRGTGSHLTSDLESMKEEICPEEIQLISHLKDAGNAEDWSLVTRLFSKYTGRSPAVHNSALTAAYRCQQYEAGKQILLRMSAKQVNKTLPTYNVGIKLFAKMGDLDMVQNLWEDALQKHVIGDALFGAKIDAAAEQGNITAAVEVLDFMYRKELSPDAPQFNSAMNAIRKSDKPSYSVAVFLLEKMVEADLQPDVITFTNAIGAHRNAPLGKLQALRAELKRCDIQADEALVENYLASLFQSPPGSRVEDYVHQVKHERLLEAASFIREVRATNVRFTGFVRGAIHGLDQMHIQS
eukprot:TRINITY_DN88318_c0_g1_i1.p1 TRINITY_DN88318_c0_g1~~TRINITY_DN88318_c0_g1_i1.p1  ORF type:complete len:371 (+),score=55.31 TRINITY_DN88318_c0_g1_i1:113-1225(+)